VGDSAASGKEPGSRRVVTASGQVAEILPARQLLNQIGATLDF
jgi:hypothetical protein